MLSPFECLCGNFILPEPASYVFFYAIFNLRKLLYIIIRLNDILYYAFFSIIIHIFHGKTIPTNQNRRDNEV
ncbi:hypothetical protein DXB04_30320 [Enterocloster bolteae]|nr:hypothetical protein DXB04_30320 [Enterocloster bolteae]